MLVVDAGRRIDQMDRREVAFAAARRRHAAEAADRDGARVKAALGERADHDVERNVMAAHDDQIGRVRGVADQRHLDIAVGVERARRARRSREIRRLGRKP